MTGNLLLSRCSSSPLLDPNPDLPHALSRIRCQANVVRLHVLRRHCFMQRHVEPPHDAGERQVHLGVGQTDAKAAAASLAEADEVLGEIDVGFCRADPACGVEGFGIWEDGGIVVD